MYFTHENAPDSALGLHVAADNVCEALVEGFPPPFLVLGSFGPSVFVAARLVVGFFIALCMTGVFLVRDPAGRLRASRGLVAFFLQAIFLDSQVEPAPAPLGRNTRTEPEVTERLSSESGEEKAVFVRLLLPALPQERSVESADAFEAAVESAGVRVLGPVSETSSFPDSISLVQLYALPTLVIT